MDDSNASALIDFAKETLAPSMMNVSRGTGDSAPVMLLPAGLSMYSVKEMLDEYAAKPERRRGEITLTTVESITAWTNRHKDGDSVVLVDDDPGAPKMRTIIDYHRAGSDNEATARFGRFYATYNFPVSEAWKRWTRANGAAMSQQDFAELIEDRAADLIAVSDLPEGSVLPNLAASMGLTIATPAEVTAASRGLKVRAEVGVTDATSLVSGETELRYDEKHTGPDGEPLKVPSAFLLGVPVFKGAQRDPLLVRLRYRRIPNAARVQWTAVIHMAEEAFEAAINEAIEAVTTGTGLPVFRASLRS